MSGQATMVSSVASDMWSFGVILYELYVGKRLFDEALPEEDIVALLCSVSAPQIMISKEEQSPITEHSVNIQ